MKLPYFVLFFASASLIHADPASKADGQKPAVKGPPVYKEESPLPKGWPQPGPYNEVSKKKYPAYRAAVTKGDRPNGGFMKLFRHIESKGIPMTAPVEMKLDDSAADMPMEQMAFLYQSPDVGKTGADGDAVEVRDLPALEVLNYAWQGGRSKAAVAKARAAIEAELAKQNLKAKGWRLFGYNSPFVPPSKQTHELQALIEAP